MLRRAPWLALLVLTASLAAGGCQPAPRLCNPQDAEAVDPSCAPAGSWKWDGSRCVKLVGCACEGADCERLFPTEKLCMQTYEHCVVTGRSPFFQEPPQEPTSPTQEKPGPDSSPEGD